MKITVKTLKGSKFVVECEPSRTVLEVKGIVESTNSDLPASNMKLIHAGKVLKNEITIESCGIKENDFLVVMVTKAKKTAAKAPAPDSTEAKQMDIAKAPTSSSGTKTSPCEEKKSSEPETSSSLTNIATSTSTPTTNADVIANNVPELPAEVVNSLTGMGFPEAEVRHCLRAAYGNPDIAVEFLTNGIPPGMQPGEEAEVTSSSLNSASNGGILAGLRNHPQFNDLRRLVQSNPAMLQRVLTQIGQQQPELLTEINTSQEAFLQMMNEPVTEVSASSLGLDSNSRSASQSSSGASTEIQGIPPGMMEGMTNPAQMAQLIQNMSPGELNQMATMMGFSSEQLRSTAQMLGQIPPEQLQQYMMQAIQGGGSGGLGGVMGGNGGVSSGGPQVLRLTEDEMAAVNRLADMGFDRTEAAQAYLACDKNEALAANLLMDSMADGDFGGGFGGGSSADGGNSSGNDGDDMYD